jgi:hypothetical protein
MTQTDKTASETKPGKNKSWILGYVLAISAPIIWCGGLMSPIVDFDDFMIKIGLRKPRVDTIKADRLLKALEELNEQHEKYEQQNFSIKDDH